MSKMLVSLSKFNLCIVVTSSLTNSIKPCQSGLLFMLSLQFAVTSEAAYSDHPESARKCLEDSQGVCVDDKIHWTVELGASSCRLVSAGYLLATVTVAVMVWLMVPLVPVIITV